jgi:hypothetical protein
MILTYVAKIPVSKDAPYLAVACFESVQLAPKFKRSARDLCP